MGEFFPWEVERPPDKKLEPLPLAAEFSSLMPPTEHQSFLCDCLRGEATLISLDRTVNLWPHSEGSSMG